MAGNTFGTRSLGTVQGSLEVSADGRPEKKVGGVTFDWSTVTAVSGSAVTLLDGTVVAVGEKYIRYGQVITKIGVAEVQTYTWTGGPTSGSAILTFPAAGEYPAQSTATLAFNASAAAVQSALQALSRIGVDGVSVARTGAGSNADPYVYTATYSTRLGNVVTPTAAHTFLGGTTPTATIATTTSGGTNTGMYGPWDSAATDGRATLTNGDCYVVNRTVKEVDPFSAHPEAIYGGRLWRDKLLITTGTHSLAAGPTVAEFLAAFPRAQLLNERPA
jgi:hypothetical protein